MITHIVFSVVILLTIPRLNKKYPIRYGAYVILLFFSGLRFGFGNDYFNYYVIFLKSKKESIFNSREALFKLVNVLTPDFFTLVFLLSVMYILVLSYLIENNVDKHLVWISVTVLLVNPYLFLVHQSGMRQTIAILLFVLAIGFAKDKRIIPYILLVLIGAGFHSSALALMPVYFYISRRERTKYEPWIITIIVLFLLVSPFYDYFIRLIMQLFPRYAHYLTPIAGSSIRSLILSSILFIFIAIHLNSLNQKTLIFGRLSLIAQTISLLTFKTPMLSRVGMYFDIFLIIAIPSILKTIPIRKKRVIWGFVVLGIYLLRYGSFFRTPLWEPFFKYRTIVF